MLPFSISKREKVSLLESNEGTFPEVSIRYVLASQAFAYSSTNCLWIQKWEIQCCFFPKFHLLWGGGQRLPPRENRLCADPSKTNKKIQQIFNNIVKNIMTNKGFCVCPLAMHKVKALISRKAMSVRFLQCRPALLNIPMRSAPLIDFRLSLLFCSGMPLNSFCADI